MKRLHNKLLALALLGFCLTPTTLQARATIDHPIAQLRSLDKITARTQVFEAEVGQTLKFGGVYIKVQACRKAPELEKPESAAFLQIWETPKQESGEDTTPQWIFSGWMFASSPGLSAMDHPIYDVVVLDCLAREAPENAAEREAPEDNLREGEGVVETQDAPEEQALD